MTAIQKLNELEAAARTMSDYFLERMKHYDAKNWAELAASMRASARAFKLMEGMAQGLDPVKAGDYANAWLDEHTATPTADGEQEHAATGEGK